jgi:hypothetical protein
VLWSSTSSTASIKDINFFMTTSIFHHMSCCRRRYKNSEHLFSTWNRCLVMIIPSFIFLWWKACRTACCWHTVTTVIEATDLSIFMHQFKHITMIHAHMIHVCASIYLHFSMSAMFEHFTNSSII